MMMCDFDCRPAGSQFACTCRHCGRSATVNRLPVHANCQPSIQVPRVAVGGLVETALSRLGITKQRVQEWTRLKDCGCERRARWLDRWGFRQQQKIERLLNRAARWYGIG
jgi:hypothetical protein